MLKIGVVGFGARASSLLSTINAFGEAYEVGLIYDTAPERSRDLAVKRDVHLADECVFCSNLDEFAAKAPGLDGIMIANFCNLHAQTACKLEPLNIPLFLEKPVAVNPEQLNMLHDCFKNSKTPVEVSFPMRLTPVALEAKKIVDSGRIGRIEQIIAYNDVNYGDVYYSSWFRDYEKTGGMFMQKAVHDIDYLCFLAQSNPKNICAMSSQRVFGGDKPFDLKCRDCDEQEQCLESPFNYFYRRGAYKTLEEAYHRNRGECMCRFSKGIKIDDIGECIMELENGVQLAYHQNFFIRNRAHRRGARLYGYEATMELDWANSSIRIYSHMQVKVEEIEIDITGMEHGGGDLELVHDFIEMMKNRAVPRTDLIRGNGINSAMACLLARESARSRTFQQMTAF